MRHGDGVGGGAWSFARMAASTATWSGSRAPVSGSAPGTGSRPRPCASPASDGSASPPNMQPPSAARRRRAATAPAKATRRRDRGSSIMPPTEGPGRAYLTNLDALSKTSNENWQLLEGREGRDEVPADGQPAHGLGIGVHRRVGDEPV